LHLIEVSVPRTSSRTSIRTITAPLFFPTMAGSLLLHSFAPAFHLLAPGIPSFLVT
jgi:hypothetical protein